MVRDEGAEQDRGRAAQCTCRHGVLDADELPIPEYDELNLTDAVAAVKELEAPADIRTIIAYEEAHKNRQRLVSAAQTRVADIAQEVVGLS